MSVYRTGTLSIANNQKVVTGSGTLWLANVKQGDTLTAVGFAGQGVVDVVNSDTQLTLYDNWTSGAVSAGTAYTIVQTGHDWYPTVDFQATLASILSAINGAGWASHPGATNNPHVTTLIQALTALGLSPSADKLIRLSGATSATLDPLTAFGRSVVAAAGALPGSAFVDVASGASPDIGAAASNFVRETGTTSHAAYANSTVGTWRWVRYAATLTLTHGASLILPRGGQNYTTAAGDMLLWFYESTGVWRCLMIQPASGSAGIVTVADLSNASADAKTLLLAANFAAMWPLIGGGDLGKQAYTVAAITPTITFTTPGTFVPTYGSRGGAYLRLADMVAFYAFMTFNANAYTGASGALQAGGLPPFNASGSWPVYMARMSKIKFGTGFVAGLFLSGTQAVRFYKNADNAGPVGLGPPHVPPSISGYFLEFGGVYRKV